MTAILKQWLDRVTLALVAQPWVDRPLRYLTYRNKRVLRRKVEARLTGMGIIGDTVLSGPFIGMKFPPPDQHFVDCRFEKLIGCFEFELAPWIEKLAESREYQVIVNIGAAEGSYAVGLAQLFPDAEIHAFEPDASKVEVLNDLARLNGVEDRLKLGGWCDPEALLAIDPGNRPTLVVCDVDGYEEELMDPQKVPWLANADIILEVHEFPGKDLSEEERTRFERQHPFLRRDIGKIIRSRFDGTHRIEEASLSGVPYERYPILNNLSMPEILAMTESDRACIQPWFFMEAKNAPEQP